MRYDYVQPFVSSASKILEELLAGPVEAKEMKLFSQPVVSRGVTAIVGVTGETEGRVLFDMAPETALQIAAAMNGEETLELDSMAPDTLSELASMMAGRAVSALNDERHRLNVSPPTLFTGDDMTISHADLETLVFPLHTSQGEVMVNVAFATN